VEQEKRVETEVETLTARAKAEANPSSTKAEAHAKPPYQGEATSSGGADGPDFASNFAPQRHSPSSQEQAVDSEKANKPKLTPENIFDASHSLRSMEIDDEAILVDVLGGKYFRLNPTGTIIWRLILQRSSLQEISDQLAKRFNLAPDRAFEEASTFVASLIQNGLAIQQGEQVQRSSE